GRLRPWRLCVGWARGPGGAGRGCAGGDPGLEKEAWISQTLLEWGSCGKLVYVDGMPAGFVMFAPPAYVPRSMAFPTSPVSPDAVLLMNAHVVQPFAEGGLGRMLVQGVARELRGSVVIRATECVRCPKHQAGQPQGRQPQDRAASEQTNPAAKSTSRPALHRPVRPTAPRPALHRPSQSPQKTDINGSGRYI